MGAEEYGLYFSLVPGLMSLDFPQNTNAATLVTSLRERSLTEIDFTNPHMITHKVIKYSFLVWISVIGLQCKSSHNSISQKAMYKSIYVDQFKLTYFRKLLKKGYNNSLAIQEIINTDSSGFMEPILTEDDYLFIDSLTTVENEAMRIDSSNGNRRSEGSQGKRPLGLILDRLSSKWLDNLANKRYKSSGVSHMFEK